MSGARRAPAGGFAGSGAILRLAPPTGAPASTPNLPCLFEPLAKPFRQAVSTGRFDRLKALSEVEGLKALSEVEGLGERNSRRGGPISARMV